MLLKLKVYRIERRITPKIFELKDYLIDFMFSIIITSVKISGQHIIKPHCRKFRNLREIKSPSLNLSIIYLSTHLPIDQFIQIDIVLYIKF